MSKDNRCVNFSSLVTASTINVSRPGSDPEYAVHYDNTTTTPRLNDYDTTTTARVAPLATAGGTGRIGEESVADPALLLASGSVGNSRLVWFV